MNGHVQPLLSDYIDGELSPPERARVEEHLTACPGCRGELEDLRAASRAVSALKSAPLPTGFRQRLQNRRRAAGARGGFLPRPMRLAAAAASAVLVFYIAYDRFNPGAPSQRPAVLDELSRPNPLPGDQGSAGKPQAKAPGTAIGFERPASAPVPAQTTNEELHAALEREKERMGIRKILPARSRRMPMGQMAGLGEAMEAAVPAPVPLLSQNPAVAVIAAATATAVAATTDPQAPAAPGVVVRSEQERAALWAARGMTAAAPRVDYERQQLVVVFAESQRYVVEIPAVQTLSDRVVVQYHQDELPDGATRRSSSPSYQFRVLPLSERKIVFQKLP